MRDRSREMCLESPWPTDMRTESIRPGTAAPDTARAPRGAPHPLRGGTCGGVRGSPWAPGRVQGAVGRATASSVWTVDAPASRCNGNPSPRVLLPLTGRSVICPQWCAARGTGSWDPGCPGGVHAEATGWGPGGGWHRSQGLRVGPGHECEEQLLGPRVEEQNSGWGSPPWEAVFLAGSTSGGNGGCGEAPGPTRLALPVFLGGGSAEPGSRCARSPWRGRRALAAGSRGQRGYRQ